MKLGELVQGKKSGEYVYFDVLLAILFFRGGKKMI